MEKKRLDLMSQKFNREPNIGQKVREQERYQKDLSLDLSCLSNNNLAEKIISNGR